MLLIRVLFLVVPGNHERSRLPFPLQWLRPGVHVLDRPRTVLLELRGLRLAVAGFPYLREDVARRFDDLVEATGWRQHPALAGRPLAAPVLYPGSTERTSFAEADEEKGFLVLEVGPEEAPESGTGAAPEVEVEATARPPPEAGGAGSRPESPGRCPSSGRGRLLSWRFERLPARPLVTRIVPTGLTDPTRMEAWLRATLAALPRDARVRLRLQEDPGPASMALSAARLRALAPPTMNVETSRPRPRTGQAARAGRSPAMRIRV